MMIYKKSFSKNNKKTKSNLKRQRHKSRNKITLKKEPQKNKKTSPHSALVIKHLSICYIWITLFITAIALMALYYKSILIYCQQAYHIHLFDSNTFFVQETSTQVLEKSNNDELNFQQVDAVLPIIENEGSNLNAPQFQNVQQRNEIEAIRKVNPETEINLKSEQQDSIANGKLDTNLKTHLDIIEQNKPTPELVLRGEPKTMQVDIELPHEPLPIVLTSNDKVFFAGDSLMQGVAPYVKKMLFKQYKIESLNLSKQSTGLAYPGAFDWSKTINDNLIADPSIKLLIVFLGANDPWDFPVKGYAKYAKFKSELWEEQYRLRIESILNSAIEHNVQVLWLAAPCMRKAKLNEGMVYLNNLYKSEIEKVQQHFLTTNELLGCTYEKFSDFIETGKTKIKVRVDDGIHFTPTGQKILAKTIMEKIIYKELEDPHSD
ncbi:hypothetical protein GA0061081_10636 [Gilliamella bombicola]|uniref:SGNH hydrolase-type esterase domain-containing protein n=1 Tax=Gilliamella bombicola TaxID=1798182 RepID=A0A1C4BX19_9GAMM|nr:hypothetical protein GA0061081_10636 [Gilliamella bombicola]